MYVYLSIYLSVVDWDTVWGCSDGIFGQGVFVCVSVCMYVFDERSLPVVGVAVVD